MAKLADVYFVRHGQTDLNADQKLRGWLDVPLNENGQQEASKLASFFEGHDVVKVVSSDLQRAADTARLIGEAVCAPVMDTKAWRPWHVGGWAGKDSAPLVREMLSCIDEPSRCPPDGEPFTRFRERVTKALQDVLREAQRTERGEFVVVTHIRDIRMILGILDSGPQSPDALSYIRQKDDPVPPGGIIRVSRNGGPWGWEQIRTGSGWPARTQRDMAAPLSRSGVGPSGEERLS